VRLGALSRAVEITTLRAIGVGGFPAFVGTLVASLLLSALGGAIGAATTYLVFDGFSTSTLGAGFAQVMFSFKLSPALIGQGLSWHRRSASQVASFRPSVPRACRLSRG
jgi:putative ABC transport system permease protein